MKRHLAISSLVAIFGLLMSVFACGLNRRANAVENIVGINCVELSFVSSLGAGRLVEVKSRPVENGAGDSSSMDSVAIVEPGRCIWLVLSKAKLCSDFPCTLWLLQRSLLI